MREPEPQVELTSAWNGSELSVTVISSVDVPPGWRLVLTNQMPLSVSAGGPAAIVEQLGSHHVLEPTTPVPLISGHPWTVPALVPVVPLRHANDGPVAAYVAPATGPVLPARVRPTVSTDTSATSVRESSVVTVEPSGFPGEPAFEWRGLHFDLARQWIEPDVVEWLIDVVAARRINRLHLHLTDDEGWRLPVPGYPDLSRAATRGHGLAMPPMLGSGPEPTGRLYEPAEIRRWVERADAAGVVLVPEVDMPAHMHAALTALPQLRDPEDTSRAGSIQGFVDNVLVPGHPPTMEFVTAVVDAMADLFPSSPWLHIGGDEVPARAWSGSPAAQRYAAEHDLSGPQQITGAFLRDVIAIVRERTGRKAIVWHDVALTGDVRPEDGYLMGWQSTRDSRLLASQGYDIILVPASAYYFDMALDDEWESPGGSWAGTIPVERVADFEPGRGWSEEERSRIVGIHACLWAEHLHDRRILEHLLLPRLDAFAERAWTGERPRLSTVG